MKNKEYWKNRIEKEEQETYDLSLEEVERQYKVLRDTEFEIKQVIKRYMNDLSANNLNENIINMEKILESDELEEFKWTYEKYVENAKKYSELVDKSNEYAQKLDRQLKNASLRYRISKKQAMLSEIQQEISLHTNKRNQLLENHLKQVLNNTKEPTNKQINIYSESFKSLEEAIKQKWIGNKNFSDRIWNDSERIIKKLEDKLPQTIATGNVKQLINEIEKEFKVSKYNAKRLVLTESARIFNKTRLKNYEDLGVENVEIIATLDLRTSNTCRSKDKSIVELKNAKIGVDLPPFHPNCRTVFIPLLEYEGSTRISRDINTNKNNIIKDKNYNEWLKEVGEKEHNIEQQKLKNKKSDLKQYRKYKVALNNSKYLPKTFEDFQNMKYNDSEKYEELKIRNYIRTKANLKIHDGKQGKHLVNHNNYKDSSYVFDNIDIQNLVNKYAGTGELKFAKGKWNNIEFIDHNENVGVFISIDKKVSYETNRFSIHYSKDGVHIVPRKDK